MLDKIDARLAAAPVSGPPKTGFPLPEFANSALLGQLVSELRTAQTELVGHLRERPDDEAGLQLRLKALMLVEEALAWEAGWPYQANESAEFDGAGYPSADLYIKRIQRGIERLKEQMSVEAAANGRTDFRPFVMHRLDDATSLDAMILAIGQRRGEEAAKAWAESLTQPLTAIDRSALLGQ